MRGLSRSQPGWCSRSGQPLLLQTLDLVQVRQEADVPVHVGFGIPRKHEATDTVDARRIGRLQVSPERARAGGDFQTIYVGRQLSGPEDIEGAAVGGPTCGYFARVQAGDQARFASRGRVEITLLVGTRGGHGLTIRPNQAVAAHSLRGDGVSVTA